MNTRQTMTDLPANPINHHLQTKQFREDRLWQYRNGQFYTDVEGRLMSEELFNELFPVYNPLSFRPSKGNIDSTSAWIKS